MKKEHIGIAIAKSLDSPQSIGKRKAEPIRYVENEGLSLSYPALRVFISWAQSNPVKAAPLIAVPAYAAEEILNENVDTICKACGACSD